MAAYAYEFLSRIIMSDITFDQMSLQVDLSIDTGRPDLDEWWRRNFDPDTGVWIRSHPELEKIHQRFHEIYGSTSVLFTEKKKKNKKPVKSNQGELF